MSSITYNVPTYSEVANKRAGGNSRAKWIFFKKLINVQGQINMQGGNFSTPKNMQVKNTYMFVQFFEHFFATGNL